ncbi:MAG: hypothetical protein KAH54_02390 [Candidatus Sabulitectum sp.]|nr:hypothetical protein [Candidatus Sabulitectum sp.]
MTVTALFMVLISGPSMFFVGNSYTFGNGGLWAHVKQIYDSVESDTLSVDACTSGGATFENHWENQALRIELESGNWDTVVFQEQSCMPVINPAMTYLYGDSLAWLTSSAGGEPVFLMTWARKNDPLMLEGLELGYSRMGYIHSSSVTPCGIAFDLIKRGHPEIDPYAGDGAHPSVHGTYLAACVIAVTVYGTDILSAGIWQPSDVSREDGEILRYTAIQACTDYQQPGQRGEASE